MPLGPQSLLKNASKLQVTAEIAKQPTSHQFGGQRIRQPLATVCVHVRGAVGNQVQSKALLSGTTTSSHPQGLRSTSFLTLQVRNPNLNNPGQKILDKNPNKLSTSSEALSIHPSSLLWVCLFYSKCLLQGGAQMVSPITGGSHS